MKNWTDRISLSLKGMAMGMAEVIPGVSGGTIAFITGIYEELIDTIKAFGPGLAKDFKNDGLAGLWRGVNGNFLLALLAGMVLGIIVGVFAISYLLENYPPVVWAFFFGLIIASAIYVGQQISRWKIKEIMALVLGGVFAYWVTVITPASGSDSLAFVFLSGTIAISALILPGISGSFMLLIMGMYSYIVQDTLKGLMEQFSSEKLVTLMIFGLGCLVGLMTVSRVLSWTFKNYRNLTLAVLTGFMIGSLNKLWPWRNPIEWLRDSSGNIVMDEDGITPKKILLEDNVLPSAYQGDAFVPAVVILLLVGFLSVFLLDRMGKKNGTPPTGEVPMNHKE